MNRSTLMCCCAIVAIVTGPAAAATTTTTVTKAPIVPVATVPAGGTITPLYGNIHAFYGNIHAFSADITPLFGSASPFWGTTKSFWGSVDPFAQPTDAASLSYYGTSDPFWGSGTNNPYKTSLGKVAYASINTFWRTEGSAWSTLDTKWAAAKTSTDFAVVATQLKSTVVDPAVKFWSTAVAAGPLNTTGPAGPALPGAAPQPKTAVTVTSAMLSKAGIVVRADGSIDPTSLAALDSTARANLFLNFYDAVMDYAGTGHVDWWMKTVGWSPALAQIAGTTPDGGSMPTVGMLDFVVSQGTHTSKQITQYGSTEYSDGHGAAVGSLIMGSVDGSGIMGVLPANAVHVISYDPYDSTNSTNWAAIGVGVATLANQIFKDKAVPMGVLNASMGVSGWTLNPGWNDALQLAGAHGRVLVIAAGNDGSTQTQNVTWNFATNPTLLVVGSVGVNGTISSFSNRPGEACLVAPLTGSCKETDKLKYHFITAPGEMILVSDGQGGHSRQSGTSLAAPLVSGAVALLQNRWPWLSNYSDETASIILKSATKMGTNPGADPVYGAGILNIAASQSPLDWSKLTYYTVKNGVAATTSTPVATVMSQVNTGTQASWNTANLSYTALETIGRTYRDFQIPLSSKLVGQKTDTKGGKQLYQSYLFNALRQQGSAFADAGEGGLVDEANIEQASDLPGSRSFTPGGDASKVAGLAMRISMAPVDQRAGFALSNTPYQTAATLTGDGIAIRVGYGSGAAALADGGAVRFAADYDTDRGGANPLLGLASGGGYVGGAGRLGGGFTWTAGFTQRSERRDIYAFGLANLGEGANRYSAAAAQVGVSYQAGPALTLKASVTRLDEGSALLGIQSVDRNDLAGGATSTGTTVGFDMRLAGGVTLSGTGTVASTRAAGGQLTTGTSGLVSTAAEVAVMKAGVFGGADHLRLALSRPLTVAGGSLHYSSVAVIDRDTGELGVVDQRVSAGQRARYAAELLYGRSFAGGRSTVSLFGRGLTHETADEGAGPGYDVGARFQFGF